MLVSLIMAMALAQPADITTPEEIFLLPVRAEEDVDAKFARQLDRMILVSIQQFVSFAPITKDDIETTLEQEALKDALGCDEIRCAMDIGGALNTPWVLLGHLDRMGRNYHLTLRLVDVQNIAVDGNLAAERIGHELLVTEILGPQYDPVLPVGDIGSDPFDADDTVIQQLIVCRPAQAIEICAADSLIVGQYALKTRRNRAVRRPEIPGDNCPPGNKVGIDSDSNDLRPCDLVYRIARNLVDDTQ